MPDITPAFILAAAASVIISSIILYLSVRLMRGKADFKNSVVLVAIMEVLKSFVLPMFLGSVELLVVYVVIWLVLVMKFFNVTFWRAVLIALAQGIVSLLLVVLGVLTILGALLGAFALAR
jgi:hypothetical protein